MAQKSRADIRQGVHSRIRKKVKGSADRPRLAVFRSLNHIYAQVIDDQNGKTLATASTTEKALGVKSGGNIEAAKTIGKTIAERAQAAGISNVVSKTTTAAPDTERPAALANVAVTGVTDTSASLQWTATGDDSLTGTATTYDVRYSTSPITLANWAAATQSTGEPAPAASGTVQNFTVRSLARQTAYYFAVKVADEAGNPSALSKSTTK